jgi:hypothetical protein
LLSASWSPPLPCWIGFAGGMVVGGAAGVVAGGAAGVVAGGGGETVRCERTAGGFAGETVRCGRTAAGFAGAAGWVAFAVAAGFDCAVEE